MKLYNGLSPNGSRVKVFLEEKGVEIPVEEVSVLGGATREAAHLKRNSLGEVPVLELDDGSYLCESVAICRYLEHLHPQNPLLGRDALEDARIEMWNRRIEQQIFDVHGQVGLHEIPMFADKIEQIPQFAAFQRRLAAARWAWLEDEIADERPFIAGDRFTVADITGIAALFVAGFMKMEIPQELKLVNAWADRLRQRPSFPKMPANTSAA